MTSLKLLLVIVLVPLGAGGTLIGAFAIVDAAHRWGSGRFWNRAEPETFVLPAGFEGTVLVAYDRADAPATEYEGTARVYRVPPHGVVRTREPHDGRVRSIDWWIESSDGRRAYLYRGEDCDRIARPAIRACRARLGYGRHGAPFELWHVSRDSLSVAARAALADAAEARLVARLEHGTPR
jgi:hypothetical protein